MTKPTLTVEQSVNWIMNNVRCAGLRTSPEAWTELERDAIAAVRRVTASGDAAGEKRCSDCAGELSECGEPLSDGIPAMDCRACRLAFALHSRDATITRLRGWIGECKRVIVGMQQPWHKAIFDIDVADLLARLDREL